MNRRRYAGTASALAIGLTLAGCAGSPSSENDANAYRHTTSSIPTALDPHNSSSDYDTSYLISLYETLLVRNVEGDLEPGLASEWSLSDDAQSVSLTLHTDRTFHDGTPITAEAVKANLERAATEGTYTQGAFAGLESIVVVDETHVSLNFESPAGHIPGILAMNHGMVVNPEYFDDPTLATGNSEAGSGAFQFEDSTENSWEFAKWEDYYDAENVEPDTTTFTLQGDDSTRLSGVRSGQFESSPVRGGQMEQVEQAGLEMTQSVTGSLYFMRLNTSEGPLAESSVRKALMRAVNREAINETLYDGICEPALQTFPENSFAHDDTLDGSEVTYDPDAAKELLADAGYEDGFDVEIMTPAITNYTNLAEVLQSQLQAIGVNATVDVAEIAQSVERSRSGDFEIGVGPGETNRPEESVYLMSNLLPGGSSYAGDYETPGLRDAIAETRTSADEEERSVAFQEVNQAIMEDGPSLVPICHPQVINVWSDVVEPMPIPPYYNMIYKNLKFN